MEFHVLSFEGPDPYSRAGGIATRISGLAKALADGGFESHLWFVGDPALPGHEQHGRLHLHRWCQWISRFHPHGVYDGEEGKRGDFASSLPPHLLEHLRRSLSVEGGKAVVLAEEWHTVDAVLHLDWLLRQNGLRHRVGIFWTANNVFGFDRVDWRRLEQAAVITTVSRYMKQRMWALGVDPVVIPNGLDASAFLPVPKEAIRQVGKELPGRTLLTKVARWDPDKRWLMAVEIVHAMKQRGLAPLLVARGGMEAHGREVLGRARELGLSVSHRPLHPSADSAESVVRTLGHVNDHDIIVLESHLDTTAKGVLFRASDAVLANSGHEPFGLVGLEAMAVGGIACTGCSGEDYAVSGRNAIVLQTPDPLEFVGMIELMRARPDDITDMRREGKRTARRYAWSEIVTRNLLPRVELAAASS